jgi:hypothetical protein
MSGDSLEHDKDQIIQKLEAEVARLSRRIAKLEKFFKAKKAFALIRALEEAKKAMGFSHLIRELSDEWHDMQDKTVLEFRAAREAFDKHMEEYEG